MRDHKKGQMKRTPQEELLRQALNACMEDQISFIPPERDIARQHTFSAEFRAAMEKLLHTGGREKKHIHKHEFVYGFNRAAACILAVLLVGGAAAAGYLILSPAEKAAPAEAPETAYDQANQETGIAEEAVEEEAPEASEDLKTVEFMGGIIERAPVQELAQLQGNIKTLVNSPVLLREAEEVTVTIGNMEEHSIRYNARMELEVRIDGIWYQVPGQQSTEEEDEWITLEPKMAQDEEFSFADYDLDYEAEQYRVVTHFDDLTLCSEFRFANPEEIPEEPPTASE